MVMRKSIFKKITEKIKIKKIQRHDNYNGLICTSLYRE